MCWARLCAVSDLKWWWWGGSGLAMLSLLSLMSHASMTVDWAALLCAAVRYWPSHPHSFCCSLKQSSDDRCLEPHSLVLLRVTLQKHRKCLHQFVWLIGGKMFKLHRSWTVLLKGPKRKLSTDTLRCVFSGGLLIILWRPGARETFPSCPLTSTEPV